MRTQQLSLAILALWPSCVARVIPPRTASRREVAALETTMANLALDSRHPVALELAGTTSGVSFLVRASNQAALAHLIAQIQALYPQAEIVELTKEDDPLRLEQHEAMTVVELMPGAAPYLSLRTWEPRTWNARDVTGADPILGVLSSLQGLPKGMRAIAQIAMLPAAPAWSRIHLRKAVEHPLEPEREAERRRSRRSSTGPSVGAIIALGLLVVLALLWRRFGTQILPLIPAWMKQDVPLALSGHLPPLTAAELFELSSVVVVIFVMAFLISRVVRRIQGHHPLYDMRQVGEKTKRVAYRVRLRLIVIGECGDIETERIQARSSGAATVPRQERRKSTHRAALWVWHLVIRMRRWGDTVWKRLQVQHRMARERQQTLARMIAAYRQYHQASGNYFVARRLHLRRAHLIARTPAMQQKGRGRMVNVIGSLLGWLVLGRARWERDIASSPLYLSSEELAALWHLPTEQDTPDVPGLARTRARTRPVPHELTTEKRCIEVPPGSSPLFDLIDYRLGVSAHAGRAWPVSVPQDVLHQNLLAVAATGKGKSTLLTHLAIAHLLANSDEGLFFMEPHGDTIAALLGAFPPARRDDITIVDLADETAIAGLNPLDMTQGRGRDKTVENILSVFIAFWKKQRSWGPRTENILQFALLALAEANLRRIERDGDDLGAEEQYTLLDVIPLLQKQGFRHMVLEDVRDAVTLDWFTNYYDPLRQSFRDEMISSIINKISKYAAAKVSRRLLGQSRATVRLADDIRAGRAILVNTASGIVGEEVSALVGATLVGLFQTSLAEQIRRTKAERRAFWVVIDEFQTYLGIDYNTMLAELRKYGGAFALATQSLSYLDELDRSLKPTVLANSDHLFAFAMSADDAKTLSPYLDGLEVADLLSLDAYTCYARLTHQGQRLPAFSLCIAEPPTGDPEVAATLRHHSNERNARPVQQVDEEVLPASQRPKPAQESVAFQSDEEEMGTPEAIRASIQHYEQSRRRGGRGKRGGKPRDEGTESRREKKTGNSLSQPFVLTESERAHPRTNVWHREDSEREESGEMGGE
jgi:hypothetical protein